MEGFVLVMVWLVPPAFLGILALAFLSGMIREASKRRHPDPHSATGTAPAVIHGIRAPGDDSSARRDGPIRVARRVPSPTNRGEDLP